MDPLRDLLQIFVRQGRDVHPPVLVDVDVSLPLEELDLSPAQPREAEHPRLLSHVTPGARRAAQRLQTLAEARPEGTYF